MGPPDGYVQEQDVHIWSQPAIGAHVTDQAIPSRSYHLLGRVAFQDDLLGIDAQDERVLAKRETKGRLHVERSTTSQH